MKEIRRTITLTGRDMIESDTIDIRKEIEHVIGELESALRCVIEYRLSGSEVLADVTVVVYIPQTANKDIIANAVNREMHHLECEIRQ